MVLIVASSRNAGCALYHVGAKLLSLLIFF